MTNRDKIIKYCQDYLKVSDYEDGCFNGLQVEGKEEIKKIVTGVSLSQKFIQEAIKEEADMIMFHHGIFGNQIGTLPRIEGYVKDRLKLLLENNINLAGFHIPLDAHPEIGNNVSIAKKLRLSNLTPFDVGFVGDLNKEIGFDQFVEIVNEKLETNSYVLPAGPKEVKRVGIISGGASPDFLEAKSHGADTFISGDIRESVVRAIEETGINFINAGHYNTEKDGIYNLGELLKENFGVEHKFIDIPCDI